MTNEKEIRRFEKLSLRINTDKTADAVATSEEAVYVLNLLKRQDLKINSAATEAIDMAISALKKQETDRWIPVTERLPEPRIDVWCNSDLGQMVGYYDETIETWYGRDYLELLVTAWRQLPEPYTEEDNDKP